MLDVLPVPLGRAMQIHELNQYKKQQLQELDRLRTATAGVVGGLKGLATGQGMGVGAASGKVASATKQLADKAYRSWQVFVNQRLATMDDAERQAYLSGSDKKMRQDLMAFVQKNMLSNQPFDNVTTGKDMLNVISQLAPTAKQQSSTGGAAGTTAAPGTAGLPAGATGATTATPTTGTTPAAGTTPTAAAGGTTKAATPKLAPGITVINQEPMILGFGKKRYYVGDDGLWHQEGNKNPVDNTMNAFLNQQADIATPESPTAASATPSALSRVNRAPATRAALKTAAAKSAAPATAPAAKPAAPAAKPATGYGAVTTNAPTAIPGTNTAIPGTAQTGKAATKTKSKPATALSEAVTYKPNDKDQQLFLKLAQYAASAQRSADTPAKRQLARGAVASQYGAQPAAAGATPVADALGQAGVNTRQLQALGAALAPNAQLKSTGNPTVDALLKNMGFQIP